MKFQNTFVAPGTPGACLGHKEDSSSVFSLHSHRYLKNLFILFLERGEGKEKERKRNIDM